MGLQERGNLRGKSQALLLVSDMAEALKEKERERENCSVFSSYEICFVRGKR